MVAGLTELGLLRCSPAPRTVAHAEELFKAQRARGTPAIGSADELEERARWPGPPGELASRLLDAHLVRSRLGGLLDVACWPESAREVPARSPASSKPRAPLASRAVALPPAAARVAFDIARESQLVRQWESERIDPWLRVVVLVAALLYQEQGAPRCRVLRLLGDPAVTKGDARSYGHQADLSVLELVDGRVQRRSLYVTGHEVPKARWIEQRLNLLFPHPDGTKATATYRMPEGVIRLETPWGGYPAYACALAGWAEWGATGRELTPRRVKI